MMPAGISQELWQRVDALCRSVGGLAALSGKLRICLPEDFLYSRGGEDKINELLRPLWLQAKYAGFDDVHVLYDLEPLSDSARLDKITRASLLRAGIRYANKKHWTRDARLWAVVRDLCGVGSTTASMICKELGWNPDAPFVEVKL